MLAGWHLAVFSCWSRSWIYPRFLLDMRRSHFSSGYCLPLTWLRVYSISAFAIIGLHVLAAAWKGPGFYEDIRILARVPGYILWKLRIIPQLFQGSRPNTAWIRTERKPIPVNAHYDKTRLS